MKPKKHAALIKAWADGAIIETYYTERGIWEETPYPLFLDDLSYRLKGETNNVIRRQIYMDTLGDIVCVPCVNPSACNVEFVFSPSGMLKGVNFI
jgi:hypothetical protein